MTGSKVSSRARMYEEDGLLCLLPTLVLLSPLSLFPLPSFLSSFRLFFFPPFFHSRTHTASRRSFKSSTFLGTFPILSGDALQSHLGEQRGRSLKWPLGNKGATRVWKSSGGTGFLIIYTGLLRRFFPCARF